MNISPKDASDLLRKWELEKRLVQVAVAANQINCWLLGRIDDVGEIVRVSATQTTHPMGDKYKMELPLLGATFDYSEPREIPDEHRHPLQTSYESFLAVFLPDGLRYYIYVLRPFKELLEQ